MQKELVNSLKSRISVIKETTTSSATGAPITAEVLVKSCRANQKEVSVNEDDNEGRVRALFTTSFIIRYDAQFTKGKANAMFVKDAEGFEYDIVSVVEKVPKRYLQINTIRRE